jgi:hypothetical protein
LTTRPDRTHPEPDNPGPGSAGPGSAGPGSAEPTGDQHGGPPVARPRRTDEEWEEVFDDDLRTSLATERRLAWKELVALAAVAVVVVLHFVWH